MRKVCPHREQRTFSPRALTFPSGTLKRVWHCVQAVIAGSRRQGGWKAREDEGKPARPPCRCPPSTLLHRAKPCCYPAGTWWLVQGGAAARHGRAEVAGPPFTTATHDP